MLVTFELPSYTYNKSYCHQHRCSNVRKQPMKTQIIKASSVRKQNAQQHSTRLHIHLHASSMYLFLPIYLTAQEIITSLTIIMTYNRCK